MTPFSVLCRWDDAQSRFLDISIEDVMKHPRMIPQIDLVPTISKLLGVLVANYVDDDDDYEDYDDEDDDDNVVIMMMMMMIVGI
jgi:hypothetical protein